MVSRLSKTLGTHSVAMGLFLVLLGCMYPSKWKISEPCLLQTWAAALPKVDQIFHCRVAVIKRV